MIRVGHGMDVHRLVEERKLILCGVEVPYHLGLLGAAAMGDIGKLFPDTDMQYKGADSIELLKVVCARIAEKGYHLSNADVTIVAQRPKLRPYIEQMRQRLADAIQVDVDQINVKATTTEKLSYEGEGLGITAHAVCLLEK